MTFEGLNGKETKKLTAESDEWKKDYILRLNFLRDGEIVHDVNLFMVSDDAKGVYFCTQKNFIKRGRKDAKFHLIRDERFFPLRVIDEEYVEPFNF